MNRLLFLILSLGMTLPAVASNQQPGQILFSLQAAAANIYRVCKPGCQFTTVQSAINQAVTDGHTSNDNAATVEVYPGVYTENVSLKPGINVEGATSIPGPINANGTGAVVSIVGNMDYTVSNGLNQTQNQINISNMNITALNGVTFLFAGTSSARMQFSNSNVQKQSGGDVNPVIQFTNTGAGSDLRLQKSSFVIDNVATSDALDLQRGTTEMRDSITLITTQNNSTLNSAVKLSNSAQFKVFGVDFWFNGPATNIVEMDGTGTIFSCYHSNVNNTLAAGNIVSYNATTSGPQARLRWCQLGVTATGYLGKNTSGNGGTWLEGSNVLLGNGGTSQNVQNGITISDDTSNATNAP